MIDWKEKTAGVANKGNAEDLDDYFNRVTRKTVLRVMQPKPQRFLDPPNLRASLGFDFQRLPSKLISVQSRSREALWDNRFNVMWSKDNPKLHKSVREYFDRPKDLEFRRDIALEALPKFYRASTYRSLRTSASKRSVDNQRTTWDARKGRRAQI